MNYCTECGSNKFSKILNYIKCDNCGKMYFNNPTPIVLVLVYNNNNEIIITKKKEFPKGIWGLVAGFVESNENAEETAIREVKEETHIEIKNLQYIQSYYREKGNQLALCFIAEYKDGILQADDDIDDAKFINPYDAPVRDGSVASKLVNKFIKIIEN